jgi:anti-repressor protein
LFNHAFFIFTTMTNSKSQKVGGSQAAGPAKCGAQSSKNKKAAPVCVFENPEFGMVRMATDEKGEPWFCAKDLCDALGYKRADLAVKQHVNQHDAAKRCVWVEVGKKKDGTPAKRLTQMIFVNESGFYALVLGSKLPSAVMFKDWVTSVVLPQIRKTGGYIPVHEGESEEEMIRSAEQILRATLKEKEVLLEKQKELLKEQKKLMEEQKSKLHQQEVQMGLDKKLIGEQDEEIHRLNEEVNDQMVRMAIQGQNVVALERQVDGLLPKAMYSDNVLDSVSCFTTTQVAKELGITAQELNRSLCSLHVQYYQSGQYMLYADYAHMGLAKSRTKYRAFMAPAGDGTKRKVGKVVTSTYLVWTEKGRKFIHDLVHRFWELAEMYEVKNLG